MELRINRVRINRARPVSAEPLCIVEQILFRSKSILFFTFVQLEDVERARIEEVKESERRKATEDLERWKEEQVQQALQVNTCTDLLTLGI